MPFQIVPSDMEALETKKWNTFQDLKDHLDEAKNLLGALRMLVGIDYDTMFTEGYDENYNPRLHKSISKRLLAWLRGSFL